MPSETRAPMDLQLQADRTFEVLLYTLPGTRFGLEERWFLVGPFAERLDAMAEYEMLCREFREDALVVLVLVAVVLQEQTGLYRDRILSARGRAPLIRRDRMASLSAQERRRLITATAPLRRTPRRQAPPPPQRSGATWLAIAGWGAVALVAALAAWVVAVGWFG